MGWHPTILKRSCAATDFLRFVSELPQNVVAMLLSIPISIFAAAECRSSDPFPVLNVVGKLPTTPLRNDVVFTEKFAEVSEERDFLQWPNVRLTNCFQI